MAETAEHVLGPPTSMIQFHIGDNDAAEVGTLGELVKLFTLGAAHLVQTPERLQYTSRVLFASNMIRLHSSVQLDFQHQCKKIKWVLLRFCSNASLHIAQRQWANLIVARASIIFGMCR